MVVNAGISLDEPGLQPSSTSIRLIAATAHDTDGSVLCRTWRVHSRRQMADAADDWPTFGVILGALLHASYVTGRSLRSTEYPAARSAWELRRCGVGQGTRAITFC